MILILNNKKRDIINSQNFRNKSSFKLMHSQNHSLAGSNQSHQIVKESGQFNIMGNGNKINFKQCQGRLNIMGNGNQIFMLKSTFEISLNGNENKICIEKGELRVGINGNNNEVIQSGPQNDSVWKASSQKITVMFNNGNNNIFPNQGRRNQGRSGRMIGTDIPEQRENFPQMNAMMNGMMGAMGWGVNFGSANTGYPYNYNYNQYYQPPPYPMQSGYWGMQMGNPFQTVYQSQIHNPNGNFGFNPFIQSNSTSNYHNWNEATINSNPTNRIQHSPTRTFNRSTGSSNGNCHPSRNGEYRYQPEGDDGRTRAPRIAELTSTRSRNNPHSRSHRQRQVIEIESDGEAHEIQQLPYFGQRPRYQFHPNSGAVRYAFNLNESVPGLSEDQVSMLPCSEHKGQPTKCSICLDDVSEGNQVTYLFCFHSFHTECGINWLKKSATCPLCQLDLRPHLKTLQ